MKKNTKKAPTITRFDANDDRMFVSDSTVMCGECFASAPYRVTPEAPGFSCHCMKYLKTSGFYFDDNHFGGDDSTMLLFRESPEDPSKTEFFGRDGNFAGTKDVGVSEFSETSKVLEKEWFSAHAAEIAAEFAQTDERNRRSNRENGWEKEASRLFEAAMRGYHPKHRYLFVGDLELDASVVRAAELIKEATGAKLVFMGDVIDRGARYPWNTDGKYVTETLMRISDHFVIGTHEAVFMFRAMEEIRNEGEVSEATFNLYFNPRSRVAVSNGGPVTARELLGVGTLPTGAEAAEGLYFAPMRERVSHALRKPGNAFMEF